ncbi:MAG: carboxypeptidase regulatory-like domain-containing protein [Pyrinomonadaceae bacterium]|nr:carboxypeptidase regulatory-like domain-containing protein [Pyrinomonadaceae bacterium]
MTSLLQRIAVKGLTSAFAALFVLICITSIQAQQTTGNVRGIVRDPNGAEVAGAQVTLTNPRTNISQNAQTTDGGGFQFSNVEPGDYTVTIEAANFSKLSLTNVRVELNQTTDLPAELQVGALGGETVEVSAGGAELVDTSTTTLSQSFNTRQVVELAQTNVGGAFGGGVNNLALLAPNVTSSGGVGVGSGGSVGGQRPRNNNFVLDGVDNNDKSVTGPSVYTSPEVVQEFSLLQNQFSAEFVRSNGGQFITVTKSGTNDFRGSVYGFIRNRYLNALDTLQKNAGVVRDRTGDPDNGVIPFPRSDFFRGGFNVGGPLLLPRSDEGGQSPFFLARDRAFFFVAYERLQTGSSASSGGITTPTAAGFAAINSIPGLSPTNLGIFNRFVPVAPVGNSTITVAGRTIPVGDIQFAAPSFVKQNYLVLNFDVTQSENTQHRARFSRNNNQGINTAANLPTFFAPIPIKQRLFSYTLLHNFTPNFINETRLAYRRSDQSFPIPEGFVFPGLDAFPNIGLLDLNIDIGPDGNTPQFGIENNYQVVNQSTYLAGNHSFKFGGDFRRLISPQTFVQRQRGDFQFNTTERFLRDISPDFLAERNVGTAPYAGDQHILFAFFQDDWRVRPNVTLNLGVNYSYQQVPRGAKEQVRNAISSVPGLLEFREPREQLTNFAPKVGIVYAPNFDSGLLGRVFGSNGKSSIRAGFSMGYDYIFDNLYILSSPPQSQQTASVEPTAGIPNFLASGGIPDRPIPITNAADARSATGSFIPDQEVPYSITYTLSFQRQLGSNYGLELRYLGTRGVHLLTQNRINRQPRASTELGGLPTFLQAPTQAQLDALPLTLTQIQARSNLVPRFADAGFTGSVVGFLSNGNSTYHGGSASLTRRFADGFQGTAAYTWSHLIDDTTAEVFSTVLSPRRVEDFQNLRRDRADSALDRRHRFVTSFIYELPFFRESENSVARAILGGFNFAGTYTAESGQKATVLSGQDSNLNGDAAADRTIRNINGVRNTASTVTALTNTAGETVGYLADNPNAEYIRTGIGAISNTARNTLQLPAINNFDFSVFKNFRFGETRRIQIRADFFNAFNHPQYIPGSPNDVTPISTTAVGGVNTITATTIQPGGTFNNPARVFPSNPRVIQMALRFDF